MSDSGDSAETLLEAGLVLEQALLKGLCGIVELAGLEARIALRSLAQVCALALVAALTMAAAILLLEAAVVAGLLAAGLPLWGALAVSFAVNCLALWPMGRLRRSLLANLRFSATRRQIALFTERRAYGDPGAAP